jgi:hypothetical protein
MIMRFSNLAKLSAVLALLAGSAAAQTINPKTVLNQAAAAVSHVQGAPAAAKAPSPKPAVATRPASVQPKIKLAAAEKPAAAKQPIPAPAPAPPVAAAKPGPFEKGTAAAEHVVHRDPFDSLVNAKVASGGEAPDNLPPGKPGLIINSLRIDGIVKGTNGMIAIVSNAQQRVYFIHEGDKLYDGSVEKITLEGVSFHQVGKDAFGKPTEQDLTKRLYPSPGEQQ